MLVISEISYQCEDLKSLEELSHQPVLLRPILALPPQTFVIYKYELLNWRQVLNFLESVTQLLISVPQSPNRSGVLDAVVDRSVSALDQLGTTRVSAGVSNEDA